ncbi:ferredoxin [Pisolithus marmoratus]|nr:ferredoxin [Pisolithus marmoratus]
MSPPTAIFRLPLEQSIKLHFKDNNGNPEIDLEARSAYHTTLQHDMYDTLPDPSDDEIDLAFGLTDTNYLKSQVRVTKEMDGMEVRLPRTTRNLFVDGKKPTYH